MKRGVPAAAIVILLAALSLASSASAQQAARGTYGIGYGFVGFGAVTESGDSEATLHLGGGGEAIFRDAVGVGAEIGFLGPFDGFGDGVGAFSVNGSYHFLPGRGRAGVRPFVTGGYTLGFRDGTANLFNFGGGVHYWIKPRLGLRLEFRDHVWTEDNVHFWGVRVGVVF